MNIQHQFYENNLNINLIGELDESNAAFARDSLDELMAHPIKRVIIDMSGLTFMDSTGIGVLIGRYKSLRGRNVPIMIANPSRPVDKVLSLTGIYKIMPKIN